MTPDVVTVGWLTTDDIVLDDHRCRPGVLGGGALYSAVGAQVWTDAVGIHSMGGRPSFDAVRERIRARGLDADGIAAVDGNGLVLWLLHEGETHKQQVPKIGSSTPDEVERGRQPLPAAWEDARGFHVAPQNPAGTLASVARVRALSGDPVVTLDINFDTYIDGGPYADLGFLDGVTAFLPSESEVARIWAPADVADWLCAQAKAHRCHMGVKLGARGCLVCDQHTGRLYRVPAFPAQVLDTTGAGDAFCGGFVAGLVAGRTVPECAAMGTVSASYVVEACGALETARPTGDDRQARLRTVLSALEALPERNTR